MNVAAPARCALVRSSSSSLHPPVKVVLAPNFWASRPVAWFLFMEDVFRHLLGVADQRNKFAFCYLVLEEDQLRQVDDIVELLPLPSNERLLPPQALAGCQAHVGRIVKCPFKGNVS